jgi:hypothetical protein
MLNSGVLASGETDEKVADNRCFSNRRGMKGCWCFGNGKSCCEWCCSRGRGKKKKKKNETSVGRGCFGNEKDQGMGCFSDWEEKVSSRGVSALGKTVTSVLRRCFGIGGMNSVVQWCFSIGEMNSAAQRCFSVMKNHQC